MKVGLHLGEAWESILTRKLAEERNLGFIHWGYGGSVCHPLTQVQPFAHQAGGPVEVLMIRTASDFHGQASPAIAESGDGRTWTTIPTGVVTTGKYALILRRLEAVDEELDLGAYDVGVGANVGTPLSRFLRGRVDKACARLAARLSTTQLVRIVARAQLVSPYAVLLKG